MERIRETLGPSADVALRYALVPDSLRRLRRRRRADRLALLLRSTLLVLTLVGVPGTFYGWDHPAALAAAKPATAATPRGVAPSAPRPAGMTVPALVAANVDVAPAGDRPITPTAAQASDPAVSPTAAPTADPAPLALPAKVPHRALPAVLPVASVTPSPAAPARTATPARDRAASVPAVPKPSPTRSPAWNGAGLAQSLRGLTAGEQGSYGIAVIDLSSGQELDLDATTPMTAASVNKLEILAALYRQAEQGRLSLDQTLRTSEDDIQDYGTGVIRYQPVGTAYPLRELTRLLIEQSDNTASYMLANLVGLSTIEGYVQGWGLAATKVGDGVSSPHDAAVLLAMLYGGRLVSADDARQMVDYLSHTAWNDRIPAGLPADITVAHKIGNQVNVVNDVGIIYLPGRPYVLSIFSADVSLPRAVAVEQQISRTVYEFQRQQSGAIER